MIFKRSKGAGFTLVELLAVIALILILMSLLMPSMSRIRRVVNRTIDMNGLRQFVASCAAYAADNDTMFPVSTREGVVNCGYCDDMAWFRYESFTNIQNYVNDPEKKVFACMSVHSSQASMDALGKPRDCSGTYHDTLPRGSVNGTHIGWNYYGGRVVNNCAGGMQAAYDPSGRMITNDFQFPLRTGGKATSRSFVTCPNWVSGSGAWNGKLVHLDPDDSSRPAPIGYPLWGVFDFPGMNVGYIDGGAAWVATENMGVFKDVNWMYFDRFH